MHQTYTIRTIEGYSGKIVMRHFETNVAAMIAYILVTNDGDGPSQHPTKVVKFTCEGTIININTTREWYHTLCTMCTKKLKNDNGVFECIDHGLQPTPTYRYNFKAFVSDKSPAAQFTFFTPSADVVTGHECYKLVTAHQILDPHEILAEIQAIKGLKNVSSSSTSTLRAEKDR